MRMPRVTGLLRYIANEDDPYLNNALLRMRSSSKKEVIKISVKCGMISKWNSHCLVAKYPPA